MSALSQLDLRGAELVDLLDAVSSFDWAARFAAQFVMAGGIADGDRAKFQQALRYRSKSRTPFFNGLFVLSVTNFELFIKELVDETINRKASKAKRFSSLDQKFQDNYISKVGSVIAGKSSGTVGGMPFARFDEVVTSFSTSYLGKAPLGLIGEVFTIVMGNPTWERLEKLLETVGVTDPLGKELASTTAMKSHFKNAKWGEIVENAKTFHEGTIRRRNAIVHNIIPLSLVEEDVRDAVAFFNAFASGLAEVVRVHI